MLVSPSIALSDKQHDNTKMFEASEELKQKGLIG